MVNVPYIIQIAPSAARQWSKLSAKFQRTLIKFFSTLQVNPRPLGAQKIEGLTGLYSQDLEHLRILYKVLEQEIMVLIIK